MQTVALAFRVVLSLSVVLALMWLLARTLRGRVIARGAGVLELLARVPMTRGSSVAVVRVADQVLVLGVTETQVTVLTVADPEQVRIASVNSENASFSKTADGQSGLPGSGPTGSGLLAGSILSPNTWRRAIVTIRERTVRR